MRRKITAILLGIAACISLAAVVPTEASASARRYSCPVGDGSVSWGKGKVCTDAVGARFHIQDAVTDGYCVQVKYWSDDVSAWRTLGPAACTTGQWITFTTTGTAKLCSPNARLYRGDGSYFTMPTLVC